MRLTAMCTARDGDVYGALRDCYTALHLDVNHMKAHFRLARCLYELSWTTEALDCLQLFKAKYPDNASSKTCEALDKDIRAAILSKNSGESNIPIVVVVFLLDVLFSSYFV